MEDGNVIHFGGRSRREFSRITRAMVMAGALSAMSGPLPAAEEKTAPAKSPEADRQDSTAVATFALG